ncbi:MAG: hypothetical protein LBJ77_01200 [Holosporales bacterium]|jgi:hypothetical protein|nr:hypothetical protein [Holosporales bacterium]
MNKNIILIIQIVTGLWLQDNDLTAANLVRQIKTGAHVLCYTPDGKTSTMMRVSLASEVLATDLAPSPALSVYRDPVLVKFDREKIYCYMDPGGPPINYPICNLFDLIKENSVILTQSNGQPIPALPYKFVTGKGATTPYPSQQDGVPFRGQPNFPNTPGLWILEEISQLHIPAYVNLTDSIVKPLPQYQIDTQSTTTFSAPEHILIGGQHNHGGFEFTLDQDQQVSLRGPAEVAIAALTNTIIITHYQDQLPRYPAVPFEPTPPPAPRTAPRPNPAKNDPPPGWMSEYLLGSGLYMPKRGGVDAPIRVNLDTRANALTPGEQNKCPLAQGQKSLVAKRGCGSEWYVWYGPDKGWVILLQTDFLRLSESTPVLVWLNKGKELFCTEEDYDLFMFTGNFPVGQLEEPFTFQLEKPAAK